jgi:hypothetical protein
MRIDKPGQHHTFAGVDHFAVGFDQCFDFTTTANGLDTFVAHQYCSVVDTRELAEITARASAFRARERDDL